MQILGPRSLNRSLNRNLLGKGLFDSASLDLRFAVNKTLDSRVTFTRASTATYVGGDGALKTAVTNLLLRSEEFDNASWGKTRSSVTANAIAAPNGALTADQLIEDGSASTTHFVTVTATVTTSTYTHSVYAKPSGRNHIALQGFNGASNPTAYFNIATGVVGTTTGVASTAITPAGNGWYRCSITYAVTSGTVTTAAVYLANADNSPTYTGDGTSGIYVWGAQLEQSATAGEYIPTTSTINSAPRFDHNPTTGESLGLLVEEARTNSVTNNTMVGAVAGTPGTNPTGWAYATASSNGLTISIAGIGVENGINYIDYRFNGTTIASPNACAIGFVNATAATGQTWTASTYWKLAAGTATGITGWQIGIIESTAGGSFVTGAFYAQTAPTSAALITQRPSATRTLSGGATIGLVTYPINVSVSGNTAIDFTLRIGLPQLEQGAFATSVISTSSATATRAADLASVTGSNFSSWYNQTEGTVFADVTARPDGLVCNFDDGSFNNRKPQIAIGAGASCDAAYVTAGSTVASFSQASTSNQRNLIATAYATDNYGFTSNGATPIQDSLGAVPSTVTTLRFGRFHNGIVPLYGTIKRLTYWPIRLSNTTLQAISTP